MVRLGIIEESLKEREFLRELAPFFFSQRVERVPEDECPLWHINEYRVAEEYMPQIADRLQKCVKETWYCHAFNEEKLFVILKGKWFTVSLQRDESWEDMIAYGVSCAKVERGYLESIPLHI